VAARVASSDKVVAWAMSAGAGLLALCGAGVLEGSPPPWGGACRHRLCSRHRRASWDMMIKKATPKGATGRVLRAGSLGIGHWLCDFPTDVWRADGPGLVTAQP